MGSTTKPDTNEPTIAPTVFSAYAVPMSLPTEASAGAATRAVNGNTPPIKIVVGTTAIHASAN